MLRASCPETKKAMEETLKSSQTIKNLSSKIDSLEKENRDLKTKLDTIAKTGAEMRETGEKIAKTATNLDKLGSGGIENEIRKLEKTFETKTADLTKSLKDFPALPKPKQEWSTVVSKAAKRNREGKNPKMVKILVQSKEEEPAALKARLVKELPINSLTEQKCKIEQVKMTREGICIEASCESGSDFCKTVTGKLSNEKTQVKRVNLDIITVKMSTIENGLSDDDFYGQLSECLEGKKFNIEDLKKNVRIVKKSRSKIFGRSDYFCRLYGEIADILVSEGHIYLGYGGRCEITPTVCVLPCARCGDLIHPTKACDSKDVVCFGCGSVGHLKSKCVERKSWGQCINCVRAKKKGNKNHDLLDPRCPFYLKAVELHLMREGRGLCGKTIEEFVADSEGPQRPNDNNACAK